MSIEDERRSVMEILGQLERRIDNHEDRINTLSSVPATLQTIDRRMWETERAVRDMLNKIDDTNSITRSIRDAQIAGKALNSVGKWVGSAVLGLLALWAAVRGFRL